MQPRNQRVIRTDFLRDNMRKIRDSVAPDVKIMAVVKADGYGHGAKETAQAALEGGADFLAVASVSEGTVLRNCGISAPVLVLGAVTAADVREGIESGLIQTICSPEMVFLCEAAAAELGKQTEVHLKVDSGMGRIGIRNKEELNDVTDALRSSSHVRLTGVFTHFSDADDGPDGMKYTENQYKTFLGLADLIPKEMTGNGFLRHCSNSAAIHRRPDFSLDMVRAGISLYGYPPVQERNLNLTPCMRWTAKISYIKRIPAGEYVSYGRVYRSEAPVRVATITCGYADGYHRSAGEKAEVLIHGKRAKIIGRICMDQMMADVTDIPEAATGDEVVLIGKDGTETITAEDLAEWSGTISYEVLINVGSRVERVFRDLDCMKED